MNISSELKEKLSAAKSIVFFTGAGISAESGISTFRGENGIWNKLKPEELANFDAFMRNPDMVWEWYQYRRQIVKESKPNRGHLTIAEFQKHFEDVTVVTQNVDNLHRRAGSEKVYELHGNIERNYCVECGKNYNSHDFEFTDKAPKCECRGLIRPDVVWFGEMLPMDVFSASENAAQNCDVLFSIGTSAVVYPAAQIPIYAKQYGAYLVEVNIEPTELSSYANESLIGKSGEILPEILNSIK